MARDFGADQRSKPKEYFVYFEVFDLRSCAERSASRAEKDLQRHPKSINP
jgi:hypothetical protein